MGLVVDQLDVKLNAVLTSTAGLGTISSTVPLTFTGALTSGTAAGMADKIYSATVSLGASATTDLELDALTDAFGAALAFAKIKFVIVVASSANNASNNLEVTRKATSGCPIFMADGDGISLRPGDIFMWGGTGTGKTITNTTDDTITFTNSAGTNTITASVIIIGTSV